jgi:hypothetical protein
MSTFTLQNIANALLLSTAFKVDLMSIVIGAAKDINKIIAKNEGAGALSADDTDEET